MAGLLFKNVFCSKRRSILNRAMGKVTLFYNCHILRDHKLLKDDLWIQNGIIIDPQVVDHICDESIDCGGALISPGFIDLKLNGAYGHDFTASANLSDAINDVAKRLPKTGVTTFCPTIVTTRPEYYHRALPQVQRRDGDAKRGAGVLGVHLDGPFISKEKPGAHNPTCIQSFKHGFESVVTVYGDLENACLVTLAPELPNAREVIKTLNRWGIRISLGHSASPLKIAEGAVEAGASMVTHLFNAMPAFHHRDPSLVGLLASDAIPQGRQIFFGLIADGNHTHPAALRMAYRIAPDSVHLVTDGVAPLGLGSGEYSLGDVCVTVEGESSPKCTVKGTDILSGSVATMDICIRHLKQHTGCSNVYALETATYHPALAMGIANKKGTLDFGTDADLVLLDPEKLTVRATYIAGQLAYQAEDEE